MSKYLDSADLAKVIGPTSEQIDMDTARDLLDAPSHHRPRIYGYLHKGQGAGQIVALRSNQNLDKYLPELQAVWLSQTTLADLISRA